ncbi:MAG: hypothetical protein OEZ68_20880 [Gammaproteobacteria bacterium]|nr:hypothetical protein [Gammaproteobacteria bacterium]MDH5803257.1 hypothetical protein [Gammaproteobacteria bacterium]
MIIIKKLDQTHSIKSAYWLALSVFFSLLLSACGGSDGLGVSKQPPKPKPEAMTQTVLQSVDAFVKVETLTNSLPLNNLGAFSPLQTDSSFSPAAIFTGPCGGSVDIQTSRLVFSQYCVQAGGETITVDGLISFTLSLTNLSLGLEDLSVTRTSTDTTGNEVSETITYTGSFEISNNSLVVSMPFTGSDGVDYEMLDFSLTGSGTTADPFVINGTVSHPLYGSASVSTIQGLVYNCSNLAPSTGAISIVDNNNTAIDVEFTSCSGYTVTVDGVSTSYTW